MPDNPEHGHVLAVPQTGTALALGPVKIVESGGAVLPVGPVADGEFLKRDGSAIVGAAGGGGVTDHAALSNLGFADSGHTGFAASGHSHTAADVVNVPAGGIAATDVQAALNELDGDKANASHAHAAGDVTSGTLDGDRLPAMSADKPGGVPATGVPSGKYLEDDGTWSTPAGGSAPVVIATLATNEETDQVDPVEVGGMAINPGTWPGATLTFHAIAAGDVDGRAGVVQLWDATDGVEVDTLAFATAAPSEQAVAVTLDAARHLYEVRIYTDAGWIYLTSAWLEVAP